MMDFRTIFNNKELVKPEKPIDYQSKIGLIGSCFVNNIGVKFRFYKFSNWLNPYGILFNPLAIERLLTDVVNSRRYTPADLVFANERWHSLHHHSDFSNTNPDVILAHINNQIIETQKELHTSTHLILTFGTAWIYRYLPTDQWVANCHKIPQTQFSKHLLGVSEIIKSMAHSIRLIHSINPDIQIILTLSPVRHLKDGMLANSRSKAQLLAAINAVSDDTENTLYFPAYELMLDDLRDYRFYTKDMLHPNESAIEYIWHIFRMNWITEDAQATMLQVEKIQKALKHKPFNPESEKYRKFLENLEEQKEYLYKKYGLQF